MKKNILIWIAVLGVMISLGRIGFAEDDMPGMSGEPRGGGEGGMMGGGQGKGKMMGMMHKDSVTATTDGGVVVMSGPRLIKYDKDLNLVKEVEIPRGKKPGSAKAELPDSPLAAADQTSESTPPSVS